MKTRNEVLKDLNIDNVLEEVLAEDCPCDDCPNRMTCAVEKMACRVFAFYTRKGYYGTTVPRVPSYKIYNQIFNDVDDTDITKIFEEFGIKLAPKKKRG